MQLVIRGLILYLILLWSHFTMWHISHFEEQLHIYFCSRTFWKLLRLISRMTQYQRNTVNRRWSVFSIKKNFISNVTPNVSHFEVLGILSHTRKRVAAREWAVRRSEKRAECSWQPVRDLTRLRCHLGRVGRWSPRPLRGRQGRPVLLDRHRRRRTWSPGGPINNNNNNIKRNSSNRWTQQRPDARSYMNPSRRIARTRARSICEIASKREIRSTRMPRTIGRRMEARISPRLTNTTRSVRALVRESFIPRETSRRMSCGSATAWLRINDLSRDWRLEETPAGRIRSVYRTFEDEAGFRPVRINGRRARQRESKRRRQSYRELPGLSTCPWKRTGIVLRSPILRIPLADKSRWVIRKNATAARRERRMTSRLGRRPRANRVLVSSSSRNSIRKFSRRRERPPGTTALRLYPRSRDRRTSRALTAPLPLCSSRSTNQSVKSRSAIMRTITMTTTTTTTATIISTDRIGWRQESITLPRRSLYTVTTSSTGIIVSTVTIIARKRGSLILILSGRPKLWQRKLLATIYGMCYWII